MYADRQSLLCSALLITRAEFHSEERTKHDVFNIICEATLEFWPKSIMKEGEGDFQSSRRRQKFSSSPRVTSNRSTTTTTTATAPAAAARRSGKDQATTHSTLSKEMN
jgi:hypothetical protein